MSEMLNDGQKAKDFLSELLRHMGFSAQIALEETEDRISLDIQCGQESDVQRIIGRHGQTVDALQHLVGKSLGREKVEKGKLIVVDAGGYRKRNIERLENLAQRMAQKCKTSGRPVELAPMPAQDRRIVHMALSTIDGVATKSEGEGQDRHIVVFPHEGPKPTSLEA